MKKSIVYLGMALLSFTNVALASDAGSAEAPKTITLTYEGNTPLCMAISKGDIEIVKKFIEYGANVNETSNGVTPLMFAARYNNVEILKLLLASGAKLDVTDGRGYTALKHAEVAKATEAIAFLKVKK